MRLSPEKELRHGIDFRETDCRLVPSQTTDIDSPVVRVEHDIRDYDREIDALKDPPRTVLISPSLSRSPRKIGRRLDDLDPIGRVVPVAGNGHGRLRIESGTIRPNRGQGGYS
jgi:hypothetical protein